MGWVLETAQGIVGYLGNVPMLYQFGGRTLVAANAAGLVVEPAYRARCIVLLDSFYRQRDVDLFVTTHGTASVISQSKALRAKALAQHDYDKVLFWVLDAHQFSKALAAEVRHGERNGSGWDLPRLVGLASGCPSPRTSGPPYRIDSA